MLKTIVFPFIPTHTYLKRTAVSAYRRHNLATIAGKMKKAIVFLADGAEEIEFTIAVDVLRRGGVDVTVAGLTGTSPVKCSRGVVIVPDMDITEVSKNGPFDAMVLPGGLGGAKALAESAEVGKLLKEQDNAKRIVAAICAGPTALKSHGIGTGKNITCCPSVEPSLAENNTYVTKQDNVVTDGNVTTSRGPSTAFEFALNLVEQLCGKEKATEVAKALGAKNVVKCRTCSGDHWTSKCPWKDTVLGGKIPDLDKKGTTQTPTTDAGKPSATSKYLPSNMRDGVAKRPDNTGMSGSRSDDTTAIRVSNLSESTTQIDLKELVKPFGPIQKLYLAKDKQTGQCKGFAYIHFKFRNDAAKAIATLHGHEYDHLILNVEWSKPPAHSN